MGGAAGRNVTSGDPDRDRVYAAEDRLERWMAIADGRGSVRVFGSAWTPEPEVVFLNIVDIQRYCDQVIAHTGLDRPVRVRARRGDLEAHYESSSAVIAIPDRSVGSGWAMRELTVLHELAHHFAYRTNPRHGVHFRAHLIRLLNLVNKPISANMLAIAFMDAGLAAHEGTLT